MAKDGLSIRFAGMDRFFSASFCVYALKRDWNKGGKMLLQMLPASTLRKRNAGHRRTPAFQGRNIDPGEVLLYSFIVAFL
ncbi:hypothetical protein [Desulfosarcina cetonica]|uniref:hypothetical protein n=1 Tax=Desulfosarcina cetonica TaxID=90730 RepID=UPI0006D01AFE|nr:hypothetical protein [Desulfosarcina cetonica]